MRRMLTLLALPLALVLGGCEDDSVSPRDLTPPAAPRGFHSVTGDHSVRLAWLANTESDVVGYRVYTADCGSGGGCPYRLVATTYGTTYTVTGLANGVTRYYAVSAFDASGNESVLADVDEDVFDTPRPAGALALQSLQSNSARSGWDLSAYAIVAASDPLVDLIFSDDGVTYEMYAPFTDTDIQDAGYATTLDAVDFAPTAGWSPTGTAELVPGHCYLVWTRDGNYAKFRVTSLSAGRVGFDWAYQTDTGNRELKPTRAPADGERVPRVRAVAVR